MTAHEELANAIILQSVKDWRNGGEQEKAEVERFFRSDWFACLTKIDPEFLLTNLQKEISK